VRILKAKAVPSLLKRNAFLLLPGLKKKKREKKKKITEGSFLSYVPEGQTGKK